MSDIIHLLPDHIANQIAAGEVIQRPASVVKELMENAVDAGAGSITVNIKDAGRTLVQVIDDGKGMSETDARMAFERHATSKIKDVQDLFSLHTMGFRGEALASIAAVAQVELRTRLKGTDVGVKLSISGSSLDGIEADACHEGSVFSIKNLFYNVPARRKFLKPNETEWRNIMIEFERVVLVNPQITFTLRHNDTEALHLPAAGLRQRIIGVFGKKLNEKLLALDAPNSIVRLEGFVGQTNAVKRRGYLNYFFVNGRYMRHPYFHKAIMQAYEPLIPAGETPDYFIYLTLDSSTIDVNIHPTKTEIKFENEWPIRQILFSAARETLGKSNAVPSIDFNTEGAIEIPVYRSGKGDLSQPQVDVNPHYNPFRTPSLHQSAVTTNDWEKLYKGFEQDRDLPPAGSFPATEALLQPKVPATESEGEQSLFTDAAPPCFQYKSRYIITLLKSGLVLIDQCRAHVRILYDHYLSNMKQQKSASQQLLFPEIIDFTASEAAMLPGLTDELRWLGFELSPMGNNSYSVSGVPVGLTDCHPEALLRELIHNAIELGGTMSEQLVENLALTLAKAAAIRPGKTLTVEEMESIAAALFSSAASQLTPDGKRIMFVLTDEELNKRFK
ncbi:MAG: DNA mismatch repair endonuclease MutL [Tannerella sp.]|jgi:DNA mismatch repair protein MutL|nr:DNA mismatch repair endonuclease MutL [Tannerella sp.]